MATRAYIENAVDNTVSVIDTATDAIIATIPGFNQPWGVTVDSKIAVKKVYVTNRGDSTISVIDASTNTILTTFPLGPFDPFDVAITPNQNFLYITNASSASIRVVSTVTDTVVATVPVGAVSFGVAITPNGAFAYVSTLHQLKAIDTTLNVVVASLTFVGLLGGLAISPNGLFVYQTASTSGGSLQVVSTVSNTVVGIVLVPGLSQNSSIVISPDGLRAYVSNFANNTVNVIDISNPLMPLVVGAPIPVGTNPAGIDITPDGLLVYVNNSSSNTVSVINTTTNTVIDTVTVGNQPISYGMFIGNLFSSPIPLPKKRRRRRGANIVSYPGICINRYDGFGNECPEKIFRGKDIYFKESTGNNTCCYKKID